MSTIKSLRARYAELFGESLSDDDTGGTDAVSQPTRPSTPEHWPAASPFDVSETTRPSTLEHWPDVPVVSPFDESEPTRNINM